MKLKPSTSLLLLAKTLILLRASTACDQTCGGSTLPFPFGFSSACPIQLNCTSNATVSVADFPVQSITSDTILVILPTDCSRPVEALRRLYTQNYAPNLLNSVLLRNCSGAAAAQCLIPTTTVRALFERIDCDHLGNGSINCYSETNNMSLFLDYENLRRRRCQQLVSVVSIKSWETALELDVTILTLGWWILGNCSCVENAECDVVSAPVEGETAAYRCRCRQGFSGDGFRGGGGCRRSSVEVTFPNSPLQPPSDAYGGEKSAKKIIIGVALGVAGIITLSISVYCFLKRRRHSVTAPNPKCKHNVETFLLQQGSLAQKRYRYSEIKKITKSFSDKLGQGGYGSVYKGILPDGCPVAVKILNQIDSNGEEFINEVASISRTSHVNIVTLLGFCNEGNRRALVYEFMPNSSLDKFLNHNQSDSRLDFVKLYEIAVRTAKGLEYLHTGCNSKIVHFDIKPQNILLDEDLCPKISDFGLAKLYKKKQSILSVLGARGTAGYIAPEVFSRNFGEVLHKSDVYSYGMMLLEMAQGRKVNENEMIQSSENYFPDKIYEEVINDVINRVDLEMGGEEETRKKMLVVGLWCIQTIPSNRPSMSKVLEMLEGSLKPYRFHQNRFCFPPISPPTKFRRPYQYVVLHKILLNVRFSLMSDSIHLHFEIVSEMQYI